MTHISADSKTTYYRVPESYEVWSGCSACGKSKREVQKAFDTGITKELRRQKRIKRFRESGPSLKIITEHRKKNKSGTAMSISITCNLGKRDGIYF